MVVRYDDHVSTGPAAGSSVSWFVAMWCDVML